MTSPTERGGPIPVLSYRRDPILTTPPRFLVKRAQGRRKVPKGPKNFRRRYFLLTAKSLTYAKSRSEPPLCVIPNSDLLAVERVDDQAFNMKFVSPTSHSWCRVFCSIPVELSLLYIRSRTVVCSSYSHSHIIFQVVLCV